MVEEKISIKTKDSQTIYGVLNYRNKSDKLIIFVHGLTGHKNEHQFYNAAGFFPRNGFATFRFDLYSEEKKARKLKDCDLKTHASDLNLVIDYFKNKFKEIFLVGHSFGGATVIFSDLEDIKSIVLWDPSLEIFNTLRDYLEYNKILDKYILGWGVQYLISKEMVESFKQLTLETTSRLRKPVKIICAHKDLYKTWKKASMKIPAKNKVILIPKTSHCFDEEGKEDILLEETLKWFKKLD